MKEDRDRGERWKTETQRIFTLGGHDTGKTGNLVLTFSRQGKHREFCSDTGKNLLTQGKYLDCDYLHKKYFNFLNFKNF